MPRERDPRRDQAFDLFQQQQGKIQNREIARLLDLPEKTVGGWKSKDKWVDKINGVLHKNKRSTPKRKEGGQPGNKNAVGNNGGAPKKNQNAKVHGFFSKFLPADTLEIIESMNERPPADLIWDQIQIQYAAIIRAQQIMFVENKDDLVKVLKRQKESDTGWEKEYELQFSWDRHASFLNAQSRAMGELRSLIKQFEELANADDERRLKLEQMQIGIEKSKVELGNLRGDTEGDAHEQTNSYVEALNAQVESVFDDEVLDDEEA